MIVIKNSFNDQLGDRVETGFMNVWYHLDKNSKSGRVSEDAVKQYCRKHYGMDSDSYQHVFASEEMLTLFLLTWCDHD